MQLTQSLHKALRECPASLATICGERRHTYAQLADRVARLAAVLQRVGVRRGDRVGMLGLNSDRYIEFLFGSLWAGAVLNPVNHRWSAAEITYSLDDCDCKVLLIDDAFVGLAPMLRERSKALVTLIHVGDMATPDGMLDYESQLASAQPVADAQRQGSDLAAVLYTGGTTGQPKGVMLSHDNLALDALATLAAAPRPSRSVALHVAPLFHVGGLCFVLQLALRLSCHVLLPGFDAARTLATIEREKIGESFMVPTMISLLLNHPDFPMRDLSSLGTLMYGAAPIDRALLEQALRLLPLTQLVQAYGQTEASPVVTILPGAYHCLDGALASKLGAAGRPVSTAEIRVIDDRGAERGVGEVGEICVRGPTIMLGYWNKPEQTASALRDGWLHSGDVGYLDADGFLYVVDRIKDMIITGGENVYSGEVENALMRHPALLMCAVIGLPDPVWGERVHAVAVRRPGADCGEADLIVHCRELIAGYKAPRSIEFRDELPLSGAGKILKYVLRDQARQQRGSV
ncbi:MAG: AMP-dependent synthetase and ligase [Hydrocarboniphaga sp.]|uniref:acyl-CoA synthetase n=1 Tax=Hydrocarboniphaga sp. TaxID=2033016 RepID=UPI002625583B|nr:long-chain fatty acid--CoA ligase [Hydrocarboniphaga sp.]MDB5970148.1 AMP-dependent synthetase and ligase [Hydrocarboniphaga sp.]